jgi:transposase
MAMRKQCVRKLKQDGTVRLVTEQGYKQTEAARSLGTDRGMLGRWVEEFQGDESETFLATASPALSRRNGSGCCRRSSSS